MNEEPFYTRQEVRTLLGINNAGVQRLLESGLLIRVPVPDRKKPRYPKANVDRLAQQYAEARRQAQEEFHAQEG